MEVNIEDLSEEIRELANASDAEFSKNEYWRKQDIERRVYEIIPLWEDPTKDVQKEAERMYKADISKAKPKEYKMFLMPDYVKMFLPDGYFYDVASSEYDKTICILAKILRYDELNGVEKFILGEELVCNQPLATPAYAVTKGEYRIVGRTKSSEYEIWNRIKGLKKDWMNLDQAHFAMKGFESFKLKKQEIFARRPEEIAGKIKEIAHKNLEIHMSHELGHIAGKKYFSYEDFDKALKIARRNRDPELENFIRAVDDAIADTVEEYKLSGKYAHIFMDEHRDALLYFGIFNLIPYQDLHPVLRELSKLESKMIFAMADYEKTGYVDILREANSEIFSNAVELATEIRNADDYKHLRKIKEDFDQEFKSKRFPDF